MTTTAADLRARYFHNDEVDPNNVAQALVEIGQARQATLGGMRSVLDGAEKAGRSSLLASETRQYDKAADEARALDLLAEEVKLFKVETDPIVVPTERDGSRAGTPQGKTFTEFLRGRIGDVEMRAQGVATGAAGGYLVPEGFRTKLVERMKRIGSVRRVAEVIHTDSGASLPFPTNDDTANIGAILAENVQVTEQDVTMGTITLGAYTYTSRLVRVSLQLLQDNAFDLDSWLARTLAARIARAQNIHFTTGTGTAQPQGIVTGATSGVTAASTTVITMDNLIDLLHSVDPAYRAEQDALGSSPEAKWMMGDTALAAIRKLKDGQGQYLLQPSVQAGVPDQLLGYGIEINPDMPAPAAGTKPVLFGNFRAGYVVRDVASVEVLRLVERYADFLQHGFLGYMRSDAVVQDAHAYRALTMAAV